MTGASKGIGRVMSQFFAREGAKVALARTEARMRDLDGDAFLSRARALR